MSTNITQITNRIQENKKDTTVVGLAGGSASGKSFLSDQLCSWGTENGFEVVVLHQDDFALGRVWKNKNTSEYRWDDPENYRLDEAYGVLSDFLTGKSTPFNAYDLEAHEPHTVKTLEWLHTSIKDTRRLVIVEGLFAWRAPFDTIIDIKVFLDVNFWHRYVLRLQRNVIDAKVADFQKVTEQYFTFVAQAYVDLLEPEKASADIVIENKIDVGNIQGIEKTTHVSCTRNVYSDDTIAICVDENSVVTISNRNGILFCKGVADDMIDKMLSIKQSTLSTSALIDIISTAKHHHKVKGGHMEYDKSIVRDGNTFVFVKSHSPERFNDPDKAERSYAYLKKEASAMTHLRQHAFKGIPEESVLHHNTLAMNALRPEDGWLWRADSEFIDEYIRDAANAFIHLESIPDLTNLFSINPSHESFTAEGWRSIDSSAIEQLHSVSDKFMDRLDLHSQGVVAELLDNIASLRRSGIEDGQPKPLVFCHHDIRQSNIAWHPKNGTKLVDWSWAGMGEPGSDITSLLIDLHKSGHDITPYRHLINPRHCLTLMGFWLGHSTWPHSRDDTVRFQQFLSALSAYEVLNML